jgi:hypothetical protein
VERASAPEAVAAQPAEPVSGEAEGEAEPAAKAGATEEELRSQVEARLADSSRMLGELKDLASGGGDLGLSAGSVEIMEEGLEEVRALAVRREWSQAKDKCDALHAQLSLLLQNARRERAT